MKTLFEMLEMNEIQNQVQSLCASSLGKEKVQTFSIFSDKEDLDYTLQQVRESMALISYQGYLPLGGLSDITLILKKAQRDGTLLGEELLKIQNHLECVENVEQYILSSELESPLIRELCEGLEKNDVILYQIRKCILPDGEVSDHASEKLYSIRKKIHQLESQIRSKMESIVKSSKDYLSIDSLTTRNDRLVLPVKSGYKNEFGGLVHAHSATGQTVYIEPEAVMVLNNQIGDLQIQEREEVQRILYELSQSVKRFVIQFQFNLDFLSDLDFIFAKGRYGYINHCCIPIIKNNSHMILMKEARHPLIDEKKVVKNDIQLDNYHMLLISGSNTGGKTVTLKTVGLLSLMALCGMPVPCVEMEIPLFNQIYVDLGDEQSIEQSLSTFSSHMSRIISILDMADEKSLVILDEIGSGTDPQEGASLAEAILSELLRRQSFVFASTHYGQLKSFAKERDDIMLASVTFDLDNMQPTYRLKLDSVGQSYAIEIAGLLGLDNRIVKHAQDIKTHHMSESEKLLETLQKQEEALLLKENELENLINQNKKREKQYQHQIHQMEKQKDEMMAQAKEKANQLIQDTKKEVDFLLEKLKKSQIKQHEIIQGKHQLDDMMFMSQEELPKQNHDLKVGDFVKVLKMNREGEIIEILNHHMIKVSLAGLPIQLHEDEVQFIHSQNKVKKKQKTSIKKSVKRTGSYELNIIGKRYEEAMSLVDKFLDDAIVLGYPHVRIIHGMGTGALRKGVRNILKKNKQVVSYRDGGPNEGGLGATMVYFE